MTEKQRTPSKDNNRARNHPRFEFRRFRESDSWRPIHNAIAIQADEDAYRIALVDAQLVVEVDGHTVKSAKRGASIDPQDLAWLDTMIEGLTGLREFLVENFPPAEARQSATTT